MFSASISTVRRAFSVALFAWACTPAADASGQDAASFDQFQERFSQGEQPVNAYLLAQLNRLVSPGPLGVDAGDPDLFQEESAFLGEFQARVFRLFTILVEPQAPSPPVAPAAPCTGKGCPCHLAETVAISKPARRAPIVTGVLSLADLQWRPSETAGNYVRHELERRPAAKPAPPVTAVEVRQPDGIGDPVACARERARYGMRVRAENRAYERAFEAYSSRLADFEAQRPEFVFFSNPSGGLDPEVMLIDTDRVMIVVFRGTDRLEHADTDLGYQAGEWITTDFDFAMIPIDEYGLTGRVHRGFWNSLSRVKDLLADEIERRTQPDKPLWLTGHSLGGVQAQLFAAYLAARSGIAARGVYVFGSPHPGDHEFVGHLESTLPGERLQRFEFMSDPVPALPPRLLGADRAGIRNFHPSLNAMQFDVPEDLSLLDGPPTEFCYHHHEWYINAAFRRIDPAHRASLVPPPPLPTSSATLCSQRDVNAASR